MNTSKEFETYVRLYAQAIARNAAAAFDRGEVPKSVEDEFLGVSTRVVQTLEQMADDIRATEASDFDQLDDRLEVLGRSSWPNAKPLVPVFNLQPSRN